MAGPPPATRRLSSTVRLLVAIVAGLTLADASVVVLALPSIITELDATVEQAAAVIGVYTLVLTGAALAGELARRAIGAASAGAAGALVFAGASVWCGAAGTVGSLLVARGVQAAGAGLVLVAAFGLLSAGVSAGRGARLWTAAAVFGTAAGPALGGAVTQAFDWRAIFYIQAPIAVAGAIACMMAARMTTRPPADAGMTARPPADAPIGEAPARSRVFPAAALGLVSAALTAVLFLLVLLLVSGWSLSPLAAAGVVTVLPVAAILASRIPGPAATRAAAGCALVAGGVLALAFLPEANAAWTLAPQLLAGAGMGLALPALAGGLLPERTPGHAAVLLAARHAGITLALAALAPVAASQLDDAVANTRERGTALVLDAKLGIGDKVELAGVLLADLDPEDPRDSLDRSFDDATRNAGDDADKQAEIATLKRRADDTLIEGILDAFKPTFLIAGGLAALAAALLIPRQPRARATLAVTAAAAAALPLAMAAGRDSIAPEPVVIVNPCEGRDLPDTGGISGFIQDAALMALDRAACDFGSSREELVLALADDELARDYERRHGVDPRVLSALLRAVVGS